MPSARPQAAGAGGYAESWQCPHGFVSAEHRGWGQNYEQSWIEDAWRQGFTRPTAAWSRRPSAGAHGVVGVVDTAGPLGDLGVLEFRVRGTAVRVTAAGPRRRSALDHLPGRTTAGQVIEAGFVPVSIAAGWPRSGSGRTASPST